MYKENYAFDIEGNYMVRRSNKLHKDSKRAFTLVELLVVLVILAILAAMLVPALTGYIKRAKRARCITAADDARVAAQAVMDELYGLTSGHNWPSGVNVFWDKGDDQKWGDRVLELMGRGRGAANGEPYILVVGVGDPRVTTLSDSQRYTVYYVGYVEDENSPAVFYVNGEWSYTYPTENPVKIKKTGTNENIRNTIVVPRGTNLPIQYFVISNRTGLGDGGFWLNGSDSLRGHSEPHFNG